MRLSDFRLLPSAYGLATLVRAFGRKVGARLLRRNGLYGEET